MKAILFDLGRVLVHYAHTQTVNAVADRCVQDMTAVAALMQETATAFGTGAISAEAFHQRLVDEVGLQAEFEEFVELYAAGIQRDDEALAYAVALQQRPDVTVGIISNTNEAHVIWLDEHVPELVEFDLVVMSNEVALIKPDPAIFEIAMELLSVLPEQTVFVDDLAENVVAAQALGLTGIVHHDWATTRPQLEAWLAA